MPTEELMASPLVGKRILIVEDEGITQLQLCKMLRRAGLEVVGSASDGEAGVKLALQEQPDIILMDINMPVMNGLDATRHILAQLSPCIVMLTAYVSEESRRSAQEAGAHGYVTKPIASDLLLPELARIYETLCAPSEEAGQSQVRTWK